jgi:hypothetical protein
MVVHCHASAEPLVGDVLATQVVQFAGAGAALEGGQDPERDQHTGIGGIAAGTPLDGLDLTSLGTQIEPANSVPDDPRGMVGIEQLFQRGRMHLDLIAGGGPKSRLGDRRRLVHLAGRSWLISQPISVVAS